MKSRISTPNEDDWLPRLQAMGMACAGAVLGASVLVGGVSPWESAPWPYAWRDVAVVYFLSALPLAICLAAFVRQRVSAAWCMGLAGLGFLLTAAMFLNDSPPSRAQAASSLILVSARRTAIALGAGVVTALVMAALATRQPRGPRRTAAHFSTAAAGLALAVLLVVPDLYVLARSRRDTVRLTGLMEQSRLGEARRLAQALLALNPDAPWQGRPLRDVAREIEQVVGQLESRVASVVATARTNEQRLQLARDLAVLGQTSAALQVLNSTRELSVAPEACSLRGTIYESRQEWSHELPAYREARSAWESAPPSAQRTQGLIRSVTGIGYSARKLGRYGDAEAAYLELLQLAPTAASHFLLAQFYEDAQQAAQAQRHARLAMSLAPDRYRAEGQKLIDKLVTTHFGCWGVFLTEQDLL